MNGEVLPQPVPLLDAVVLAKGPDLLGERANYRLTQCDVGAMIDRGQQKWYNRVRAAARAVGLCVGDHEPRPDIRARLPDQFRGWGWRRQQHERR